MLKLWKKSSVKTFGLGYTRKWHNMKQRLHKIMNPENILLRWLKIKAMCFKKNEM